MNVNRKRMPLSDCTNAIPPPPPSIKNTFLTCVFKNLLNDVSGKSVVNSNSKYGSTVTENSSSGSFASTPTKISRVSDTADWHGVVEPSSIYGRRSTATKRTSKGKQVAVPGAGSVPTSIKTARPRDKNKKDGTVIEWKSSKTHDREVGVVHYIPVKWKQDEDALHAKPKEFIREQNAYFADIDRFELLEEEGESFDQLE